MSMVFSRGQQSFLWRAVNILDSAGHRSLLQLLICSCIVYGKKSAIDNTWTNEHDCVPVKMYLLKQAVCGI